MDYLYIAVGTYLFYNIRYFVFASLYYFLVYRFFNNSLKKFKIKKVEPTIDDMKEEMFWGSTVGISYIPWMLLMTWMYQNGHTQFYFDVTDFGHAYIALSVLLIFILHDTYFFWFHYWFHKSKFARKFFHHHIHHKFVNPTPFSAFSTHPLESFMELGFRAVVIMILPLHPIAIASFLIISFFLNCLGHSGYEFFPRGFSKNPLTKFTGNATHHYIHHAFGNYHYSLYFTWWDKIMGTEHPDYHRIFDEASQFNPINIGQKIIDNES